MQETGDSRNEADPGSDLFICFFGDDVDSSRRWFDADKMNRMERLPTYIPYDQNISLFSDPYFNLNQFPHDTAIS